MRKACMLLLLLCTLGLHRARAQATDTMVYLTIVNDTVFTGVVYNTGGTVTPLFSIAGVAAITSHYTFACFQQAYPTATAAYLRQVYKVICNNTLVAQQLKTAYPDIFPYYEVQGPVVLLGVAEGATGTAGTLYPNPAGGQLYLCADAAGHATGITATDMSGRQMPLATAAHEVNISALPPGTYCFRISFDDRAEQRQVITVR